MNKKTIIIITICTLAVLIAGYYGISVIQKAALKQSNGNNYVDNGKSSDSSDCIGYVDIGEPSDPSMPHTAQLVDKKDICQEKLALEKNSIELCKKISSTGSVYETTVQGCINKLAQLNNNYKMCYEMPGDEYNTSTSFIDDCLLSYMGYASATIKNTDICSEIKGDNNRLPCVEIKAKADKNVTFCFDKILSKNEVYKCIRETSKNIDECKTNLQKFVNIYGNLQFPDENPCNIQY